MAVKITGYYKLPNEIEPQLIEFDKVFNISFMRKYTKYKTFAKFLTGGKFNITCQKDFEELPEELLISEKYKEYLIYLKNKTLEYM